MSNIPYARTIIWRLLDDMLNHRRRRSWDARLALALEHMTRESPIRKRAPVQSAKVTPKVRRRIVELAERNISQAEIAHLVGVNPGRVSEVLRARSAH